MPRLSIKSLNFVKTADKLKAFSLTYADGHSMTYFADLASDEKMDDSQKNNKGDMYDLSSSEVIHALYDVKDAWYKTYMYVTNKSSMTNTAADLANNYYAKLKSNVYAICSYKNYFYQLGSESESINLQTYDKDINDLIVQTNIKPYNISLSTYLYNSLNAIKKNIGVQTTFNDDQISVGTSTSPTDVTSMLPEDLSSYIQVIKNSKLSNYVYWTEPSTQSGSLPINYLSLNYDSTMALNAILFPQYNFSNILYNNILEIPGNIYQFYDDGCIAANNFRTKNQYDTSYSMNVSVSSDTSSIWLKNCRKYVDINEMGGYVYLKYYDNIDYSNSGKYIESAYNGFNINNQDYISCFNLSTSLSNVVNHNYQHIEVIKSMNRFSGKSAKKSNLYSLRITSPMIQAIPSEEVKKNIKQEIMNAVREITKNICPANTQLYDVYYK